MSMIERIARAIHDAMYSDEQSGAWMSGKCPLDSVTVDGDINLIRAATAAIQAMREPTMDMLNSAVDATGAGSGMSWANRSPQKLFDVGYKAMIDAAAIDTGAGEG